MHSTKKIVVVCTMVAVALLLITVYLGLLAKINGRGTYGLITKLRMGIMVRQESIVSHIIEWDYVRDDYGLCTVKLIDGKTELYSVWPNTSLFSSRR